MDNLNLPCVCGHLERQHFANNTCIGCWNARKREFDAGEQTGMVHLFRLDNLKLIEDLAKERGLI